MADLKHLGFMLTLAAWIQQCFHGALGWCSTGRGYLPEAADKAVQSAVDAGVSIFHPFVAPILPRAQDIATSWLEWVDEKMGQPFIVVVDFYETTKSDIAAFVAQLKDTHRERLESFVAARELVSSWFKDLAKALNEEGVNGGAGFVATTIKEGAIKASKLGPVAALLKYCQELWHRIAGITMNSPSVLKPEGLFVSQMSEFLQACLSILQNLPELAPVAAAKATNAFSESWAFGVGKVNALLDTLVASPQYGKAIDSIGGVITWAQGTVVFEKISAVVGPYTVPIIEMVEGNQLFNDCVERMKPIKRD